MNNEYKFTSKIDNATGRFVIPKRMLRELNWDTLAKVDVIADIDNNRVVIMKPLEIQITCVNCGKELEEVFKFCPYCGKERKDG